MNTFTVEPGAQLEVELGSAWRIYRRSDIATTPGGAVSASTVLPIGGDIKVIGGFELTESTGSAAASVRLLDGSAAGGAVIARVNLLQSETSIVGLPGAGAQIQTGSLYLQVISGSVEGRIYWR